MMQSSITTIPAMIFNWHDPCFSLGMDFDAYTQAVLKAERFPLGDVLICILVATACIASLLVLAWFLFRTKLPHLRDVRRKVARDDKEG